MKRERAAIAAGLLLLAATAAPAQDLLDPDVAFKVVARLVKPDTIELKYETARGYYLYRDRLAYALTPVEAQLGQPKFPPGKIKQDEFFGKSVIYRNRTIVRVPVSAPSGTNLTLTADLQGCADIGVCYPPVRRTFSLASPAASGTK
ncbi:MAG: protein-disulfide reductase DsbD N-terminal domain-containing protein [Betaproteobacteria bacterium]